MGSCTTKKATDAYSPNHTFIKQQPTPGRMVGRKESVHLCTILDSITNHYKFQKVLGKGHFGVVREATKLNCKLNKTYAIKSIKKESCNQNFEDLKRELEILYSLDHPNIIQLYEIYEDKKYLHMVTEHCNGGSLMDRVLYEEQLSEYSIKRIMWQIFSAVSHMHASGICHRDLKPDNILFTDDSEGGHVKIIDFGLGQVYCNGYLQTQVGTPNYVAPEVLQGTYRQQ